MAFYCVLSAHLFKKANLNQRSLRCYQSVFQFYASTRWFYVIDHFRFTLARRAYALRDSELAARYFISLLEDFAEDTRAQIPVDREITYLREFVYNVETWKKEKTKEELVELNCPPIVESLMISSTDILADKNASKRLPDVALHQPIKLHLGLRNPFQTKLPLADMKLHATLTDTSGCALEVNCTVHKTLGCFLGVRSRICSTKTVKKKKRKKSKEKQAKQGKTKQQEREQKQKQQKTTKTKQQKLKLNNKTKTKQQKQNNKQNTTKQK